MTERVSQLQGTENLPALPKGWVWGRLRELAEVVTGNTPSKKDPQNYGNYVPFVKPPELDDCVVERAEDNLSQKGVKLARVLPPDSVLVSCIGILGKTGINKVSVAFNQQINAAIFHEGVMPKYGFYYSQTLRNWLYGVASATTLPIVNKSKFELAPIPLPPFPEQHRIVAKIEELFTKLEAGVEALNKVKAQLKRYRQAVLKHAFEGKLTEEWRGAHKHELEPASILLERIKEERRKNAGIEHRDLLPLNTSDLPELPDGWVWARIGELSEEVRYGFTQKATSDQIGPKFLRITDIQDQSVNWDSVPHCRITQSEKQKYLLKQGDLVFARTGATVGKSFLIKSNIPEAVFASYLIRIVLHDDLDRGFVYNFFQSPLYWLRIYEGQLGIGQPNVNATTLSQLTIPLPPLPEQHRIVDEIERRLSIADELGKVVGRSLGQGARLRQSILKKAFEGKLVPQDPSDEPADRLLERIRQERARLKENDSTAKGKNARQLRLA